MFLENISLKNFKCFPDNNIKLSRLTLLLGANSSGKSSIIYSLLTSLQSEFFPLDLSLNGSLITLGDYNAIAFQHNSEAPIEIGLTFAENEKLKFIYKGVFAKSQKTRMPFFKRGEMRSPILCLNIEKHDQYKVEWKYDESYNPTEKKIDENKIRIVTDLIKAKYVAEKNKKEMKSIDKMLRDYFKVPASSGSFSFSTPSQLLSDQGVIKFANLAIHIKAMADNLEHFNRSFNYVGSFRLEPQRSYYHISKEDLKVKRDGANHIEQILNWHELNSPELSLLTNYLKNIGLISVLKTKRLKGGTFEVRVKTKNTSVPVSLPDVGFGVGQVLPILVADLQLPKGGTFVISQPEIHLHPSVQADLANHFVNRSQKDDMKYIIETHSEYLINRLRLLIAKRKISPKDVSIVYLSSCADGMTLHEIIFHPDGRIEGAPKDFFQTYMMDVMNLALEAK